jgi:hypothetical protein
MEKKTAAQLKTEGDELGKLIMAVKKREHSCALLIGKDGLVLEAHPTKSADAMRQAAKKGGGGSRGLIGMMSIDAKTIIFAAQEEDPPRTLPKLAKVYLRDRGLQYKVLIKLPDGSFLDSDAEEEGDELAEGDGDAPADAPGGEEAAEPGLELQKEFDTLAEWIAAAKDVGGGMAKKIETLEGMFRAEVAANVKKAKGILTLLKTMQDNAGPGAADEGEAEKRRSKRLTGLGALEQSIDDLLKEFS